MKKAIVFGSQSHLIGILEECRSDKPLVLMWNVGVINRTGPYRFQTEMAQTLLEEGFFAINLGTLQEF